MRKEADRASLGEGSRNSFGRGKPGPSGISRAGCDACRPRISGMALSPAEERLAGMLRSFDWNEEAAGKLVLLKRLVLISGDSAVAGKMGSSPSCTVLHEKKGGLEVEVSVSEGNISLSASHYAPQNGGNYFYHALCEGIFSIFGDANIRVSKREDPETAGMCIRTLEASLISRPVPRISFGGC